MPALLFFVALVRVAILMAIALAAAAVIFYRHQSRQLQLENRALHTRLHQLQQRDTQRTESFATTVHELRSPLTSIRGALVLLSAGALGSPADGIRTLDERAANLLRIAASNTGRLVRLIDELLELERMDAPTTKLELHPCSLDAILAQAVDTMSPMAQEAAIEIEVLPTPSTPSHFAGDADRIVQVLCNLLSNAIKFSPHGSTVTLSLRAEPHHLVLRVQDQGRGIPGNKLEAIFDRFVRVGQPLSAHPDPRRPGIVAPSCSGLGLAISRSLATLHGGTLHAERNDSISPGRPGTTFTLRLPRLFSENLLGPPPASHQNDLLEVIPRFDQQNSTNTQLPN